MKNIRSVTDYAETMPVRVVLMLASMLKTLNSMAVFSR